MVGRGRRAATVALGNGVSLTATEARREHGSLRGALTRGVPEQHIGYHTLMLFASTGFL